MDVLGLRGNRNHGVYRNFYPMFLEPKGKCLSKDARGELCIGNLGVWDQCETCLALHPIFNTKTEKLPTQSER